MGYNKILTIWGEKRAVEVFWKSKEHTFKIRVQRYVYMIVIIVSELCNPNNVGWYYFVCACPDKCHTAV